jgi:DNA primase
MTASSQKFMDLRDSIARCKAVLPLPTLWTRLALPGEPKRSCSSPFRGDKNASFSVFEHDGIWFWRDHALGIGGDEIDLLMVASGLDKFGAIKVYHELAGVPMPEKKKCGDRRRGSLGKLVKVYDYQNADGALVHQTLRYEPKRFLQRRPAARDMRAGNKIAKCDRNGNWWLWTLHGIDPVLYHLPHIVAAAPDAPIYVCEGEKDADALAAAWGIVATTAPMGAGKWRPSYTAMLKGRDVIIWSDRDPAGEKHMERVAQALYPVTKRLRIMDWQKLWPDAYADPGRKLDVFDFLNRKEKNQ